MKISKLKLYTVKPRWLFLKMETDEGLHGWGEPIVEGRAATVKAAVEELSYYIMGENPFNIEDLWQKMYRAGFYRGGPEVMSAIAGIDQALWDIKGKALGVPVYELLGGRCRDRIRVYGWIGGDRPSDVVAAARERMNAGITAVKLNGTDEMHYVDSFKKIQIVVDRIASVRDAFGHDIDIGVDFHGRVHKAMAKVLAKELDPFKLMFIEEPVLSENIDALRDIVAHTSTPIATGERMYSRWDFRKVLEQGYVDIIQPDLSHAGGISECKKIAAMAEAYDIAVAPHCPLGPVDLAACIQLDACTPNAFIQEQSLGIHYNAGGNDLLDYMKDPSVFAYENGHVSLPAGPGLGVELDEDKLIEADKEGHNWKNPVWRNEDGTIAEW